jgi:hypothetical protein
VLCTSARNSGRRRVCAGQWRVHGGGRPAVSNAALDVERRRLKPLTMRRNIAAPVMVKSPKT